MRIFKLIIAILLITLIIKPGAAALPEYAKPKGAYQKKYDMSFFVWKPLGLHSKWYATYDGYPVTEIARDQWVYGIIGSAGQISESITSVGSIDPDTVHILTPLPSFYNDDSLNKYKFAESLKNIFKTKCDSFSIAYTKTSPTLIAWESKTYKTFIWGGKRWIPVNSRTGEKLSNSIKRVSHTVSKMLKDCKIIWTQTDTFEFANYVMNLGYNWIDNFEVNMPLAFNEINSKSGGGSYKGNNSGETNNPDNGGDNGGWDTGRNP